MADYFDNPSAFAPFKERVLVRTSAGGIRTDVAVDAVALFADGLSTSVGPAHGVEGESWTVQIQDCDWNLPERPAFGDRVTLPSRRGETLVVQFVAVEAGQFTLTCVRNMRAGER